MKDDLKLFVSPDECFFSVFFNKLLFPATDNDDEVQCNTLKNAPTKNSHNVIDQFQSFVNMQPFVLLRKFTFIYPFFTIEFYLIDLCR